MEFSKSIFSPLKAWKYLIKKPVALSSHDIFTEPRKASDRYRGFHVNNHDECTGCGTCSEICPAEAITLVEVPGREKEEGRTNELPVFDYGRCCFCGLCVDICTSDSLGLTQEYMHISTDIETFVFMPDELGIHNTYYPDGYRRDSNSELLDLERYKIDEIPHEGRNDSFVELIKGFSKKMAIAEASRCVECGICTDTCPANMNIPEYILSVYEDKLDEGLDLLYKTNPLPHACGRICTHKCETACVIGNRGEAVSIRWLKRFIVDNLNENDYKNVIIDPVIKQIDKKIGIVGAGPAGLSAAYYLRTLGYQVTIYESRELPGGVIRYGVPEYRLPDASVQKDIEVIEKIGVKIKTSITVGKDITLIKLKEKYDAVFIATGLWTPKKLNIKNNDHEDVVYSNDFLEQARDYLRNTGKMPDIHRDAIVIGGGDVSFDVARTLVRLQREKYGKHHVEFIARKCEEHLAASREEVIEAREEGVLYNLDNSPVEVIIDENTNKITGVKANSCQTICDEIGCVKTVVLDSIKVIEGTQVYFAVGSSPNYDYLSKAIGEFAKDRDKIIIKENSQIQGNDWLFAGGDIVNGPDVITAIEDGHRAAKGIDEFLMK